jgi:phosphoglycolate phosphatase
MPAQANRADCLLIFDLDGTLYDTRTSFIPTMQIVYAEYGLPYPSDEAVLALVGEPFPVFLNWLIEQGFPTEREALARHISDLEFASIRERGALFPGVRETLGVLSEDGYVICLCTNGDRRYTDAVLSACGVLRLFAELETNEEEGRTKVDLVRDLLRRVPHERAFMIGDRRHDMDAGRANGCTVIAAAYGYGSPRELEVADCRISTFSDLVACLS